MSSRYMTDRAKGIASRKLGDQSESDLIFQDVMAHAAEVWAVTFFGMDASAIVQVDRPDRGFDFRMPCCRATVDVKWTRWTPGQRFGSKGVSYPTLNGPTWKERLWRAEIYLLVMGGSVEEFDRYDWAHGWATREELAAARIVEGRYGRPYHALGFDYLHPLDELPCSLQVLDDVPAEALV
jgi:hypothetical protein